MGTVTRSVGVMPFQGGTFNTVNASMSMVRLTNSRMVWTTFQNSPNWMIGTVVDTPGGWINSTGTPVVTNQQLLLQTAATLATASIKINSTTYMVARMSFTGQFLYDVFEVDVNGIITKVDGGQVNKNITWAFGVGIGTGAFEFIYHQDNLISYNAQGLDGTSLNLVGQLKATYDATAKKLTWDTTVYNHMAMAGSTGELISKPVPGTNYTLLTFRHTGSAWSDMRGCQSVTINNTTGIRTLDASKLPNTYGGGNTGVSELVPVSANRYVYLTSPNSIQFTSINWDTGAQISLGSGQFTTTIAQDGNGRFVLPLTPDYVVIGLRLGTFTPSTSNQLRFKVVRRIDQQFFEQSAASSNNNNLGFGTNALPTTFAQYSVYPEIIDGKIFYWGTDSTGLKLSWTVIGLATA